MKNLIELGRYGDPHPEYIIIQDMLNTLYSKSDQIQSLIEVVESKEGLDQIERESLVNSYGLSSCLMDEAIVKYLTISIAALYERILKEFHEKILSIFSDIDTPKNAKGNEVRDIVKVTKHY